MKEKKKKKNVKSKIPQVGVEISLNSHLMFEGRELYSLLQSALLLKA